MFKQLRNKFLMLNLVIISIMMLISFSSIYLITYKNVQNDIRNEINKLTDVNQKNNKIPKEIKSDNTNTMDMDEKQHPGRSVSFTLIIDNDNNIVSHSSMLDMDEDSYESAKEKALSLNTNEGRFKLDDTTWEFLRKPSLDNSGYKIVFLDVTDRYSYLTSLIYTFSAVAFVMLIAIFFISRFFANRSIKPIKETFDRQKQFIADASHELKTPLAVINTNTKCF